MNISFLFLVLILIFTFAAGAIAGRAFAAAAAKRVKRGLSHLAKEAEDEARKFGDRG